MAEQTGERSREVAATLLGGGVAVVLGLVAASQQAMLERLERSAAAQAATIERLQGELQQLHIADERRQSETARLGARLAELEKVAASAPAPSAAAPVAVPPGSATPAPTVAQARPHAREPRAGSLPPNPF